MRGRSFFLWPLVYECCTTPSCHCRKQEQNGQKLYFQNVVPFCRVILSATISAPMTAADALAYMEKDVLDELLDPTKRVVKSSIGLIAA